MKKRRAYSSPLRAERAAATKDRILDAAQRLFADPSADLTLERIAAEAGVSPQTVLRAYGSKEDLVLAVIGTVRESVQPVISSPPRTLAEAVTRIYDDYEQIGDRVVRMLAEEHRIPGFAAVAAEGRARHREWVATACRPWLSGTRGNQRRDRITAAVAATDVYLWQLLRRDLGLSRAAAEATTVRLLRGALGLDEGTP